MSGLTAIVIAIACNCNIFRVLLSTCDHFGNGLYHLYHENRFVLQREVYFVNNSPLESRFIYVQKVINSFIKAHVH